MNSLTTSSYRLIRGAPTSGDNNRNVTDAQVAGRWWIMSSECRLPVRTPGLAAIALEWRAMRK